jgi:trimethylamine monooxygenase
MWVDNLYRGIFWKAKPKLIYHGMQDQFYTFNMFDTQAWLARDFIIGKYPLPEMAEQDSYIQGWLERQETLTDDESLIRFQGDYVKELIELTDYPTFDVEGVTLCFLEWEHHKHEDIMTFLDHAYKSFITGNMAPVRWPLKTPSGRTALQTHLHWHYHYQKGPIPLDVGHPAGSAPRR